jgi:hypothetical protein
MWSPGRQSLGACIRLRVSAACGLPSRLRPVRQHPIPLRLVHHLWQSEPKHTFGLWFATTLLIFGWEINWNQPSHLWEQALALSPPRVTKSIPSPPDVENPVEPRPKSQSRLVVTDITGQELTRGSWLLLKHLLRKLRNDPGDFNGSPNCGSDDGWGKHYWSMEGGSG